MADDEKRGRDKDAILARRRFFIASAVAGVVATSCDRSPMVCLEVAPVPTSPGSGGGLPPPRPCLEVLPPEDASTPASEDAGIGAADDAGKTSDKSPQPCLSVPAPRDASAPPPQVCLKVARPKSDK